jgi:hypothetical protein
MKPKFTNKNKKVEIRKKYLNKTKHFMKIAEEFKTEKFFTDKEIQVARREAHIVRYKLFITQQKATYL